MADFIGILVFLLIAGALVGIVRFDVHKKVRKWIKRVRKG